MSPMRIGCQTYTWQMSYDAYRGRIGHILDVVARAGFVGLEAEFCMLGAYEDDPARLAEALAEHDVALAALTLVLDWAHPRETKEERVAAERAIDYVARFPGTLLGLCQLPGEDRANLRERQENAIACINAVARRAAERGLVCAFHPNSPPGSLFRVGEDYELLLEGLDAEAVGFMPDFGHIAAGGMDAMEICRVYHALIRHVHFKDIDTAGAWTAMGDGVIDFPGLVSYLRDSGYEGWIIVEEESAAAEDDPDGVTLANGAYVRRALRPLVM